MKKKISKIQTPITSKSNILAIDLGRNFAWAFYDKSSKLQYGVNQDNAKEWNFTLALFFELLQSIIDECHIKVIVYENPTFSHYSATAKLSQMIGLIKLLSYYNEIETIGISPTTVKKYATGNGRSKKPEMIKAVNEKHILNITNDNIADAIHILHYALDELS